MNIELTKIMNHEPIFCTQDTRIAEIKYLLKKYDCDELIVLDSEIDKHPIGLISLTDMNTDDVEDSEIPSDVSASECMRVIPAVVGINSTLDECMNVMRANHLERIPVVDMNGHMNGVLERNELARLLL